MTLDGFVQEWEGKFCEKEDPSAPNQCFDLAFAWCDALAIDRASIRHAFAYQVFAQPNDLTLQNFDYIPNTPNGLPKQGDLVVWAQSYGGYGHIGIATGKSDLGSFDCFEQNDPVGSKCHIRRYSYDLVLGWLRPKRGPLQTEIILDKETFEKLVAKSDEDDKYRQLGYGSPSDIQARIEDYKRLNGEFTTRCNDLQGQANELTASLATCRLQLASASPTADQSCYSKKDILVSRPFGLPLRVIHYESN
jgi:hypothetical protein